MSAVFIASVFKKENPVSTWTSSTEVANIWQPKLSLDDLETHRHRVAELHEIKYRHFCSYLRSPCTYHTAISTYERMLNKPISIRAPLLSMFCRVIFQPADRQPRSSSDWHYVVHQQHLHDVTEQLYTVKTDGQK